MAVRTKSLVSTLLTSSLVTKYTCPANETTIAKWLAIYNPNGVTRTITITAGDPGAPRRTILREAIPTLEARRFDLWLVLQPTWIVEMQQDAGSDVQVTLSGTQLEGVAD